MICFLILACTETRVILPSASEAYTLEREISDVEVVDKFSQGSELSHYEDIPNRMPLDGWELFLASRGAIGLPFEAFLGVYARKGKEIKELVGPKSFTELEGIKISTTDEALAVARFFTRLELAPYFESPHYVEPPGRFDVSIRKENDNFIIERELGFLEERLGTAEHVNESISVYLVRETIGQNGSYQVEKLKQTKPITHESLGLVMFFE